MEGVTRRENLERCIREGRTLVRMAFRAMFLEGWKCVRISLIYLEGGLRESLVHVEWAYAAVFSCGKGLVLKTQGRAERHVRGVCGGGLGSA